MSHTVLQLSVISIAAADPRSLADFWAAAAGGEPNGSDGGVFVRPVASDGLRFHFHRVSGTRIEGQRVHLEFRVAWGRRRAEVKRLTDLGAALCWEVLDEPCMRLTAMADPEGNIFRVIEVQPGKPNGSEDPVCIELIGRGADTTCG